MVFKRGKKARKYAKSYKKPTNYRTGGYQNFELKFVDDTAIGEITGDNWTGSSIDPLAEEQIGGVAQGDGPNERNGRKIVVKQINIRGQIALKDLEGSTGAPGGDRTVRLILFADKQTNKALADGTDVMTNYPGFAKNSFRNLENTKRFQILGDKTITLDHPAGAGLATTMWAGATKAFQFNVRMNTSVNYVGAADTIANVADVSYHLIACSTLAAAMTYTYNARTRYIG